MRTITPPASATSSGARRPELQRARVEAEQGEAVGKDVVHLPRDAAALGHPGLATRSRCSDSSRSARSRSERMTLSPCAGEQAPAKRHRN